ncbi:hypothetical protein, partial [Rhizobium sp. J15]|uniref:hypothetical protein n=1 Tax=Rhizobium sp. J15 TaxID=2035450 RepID=UPI001AED02B3
MKLIYGSLGVRMPDGKPRPRTPVFARDKARCFRLREGEVFVPAICFDIFRIKKARSSRAICLVAGAGF